MLKGLYLLDPSAFDKIYGEAERAAIAELVDVYAPLQTAESVATNPRVLRDAEIIFSGWGMARMDGQFLAAAPRLQIVFYGAGSIRYFVTEASWERGVRVTSAYAANAVPVSEYTLSQILFALKRGWYHALTIKQRHAWMQPAEVPGAYGSTVGIISLGMIGRLVVERLRPFDVHVLAYDPYVVPEDAVALGVELCDLEDVFRRADVVSLHTPKLPETLGMIRGHHLASMKPGATFINTARGAIVREDEMIEVLRERPDLYAVLDVTDPEPPVPGSPLYTLPNVVLTPHIAGSLGPECRRMGHIMVEELRRYVAGHPLKWEIDRQRARIMA